MKSFLQDDITRNSRSRTKKRRRKKKKKEKTRRKLTAKQTTRNTKGKRKKRFLATDDYYELLSLTHLRWKATNKDIRDAYRRMVLLYHPDKNPGIDDTIFKKIQLAYDVLSNESKRKTYDSQEGTDLAIPTEVPFDSDFFKTFGIVFDQYGKWSVNTKVPDIGTANTPFHEVEKFYDFWHSFKSWRDFSFDDEFDLEEAESRDERRWMERQNKKNRKSRKRTKEPRSLNSLKTHIIWTHV